MKRRQAPSTFGYVCKPCAWKLRLLFDKGRIEIIYTLPQYQFLKDLRTKKLSWLVQNAQDAFAFRPASTLTSPVHIAGLYFVGKPNYCAMISSI